jgi:modified peptide precursor CbpA
MAAKAKTPRKIIAVRRACKSTGTGLSHFVLMDKGAPKAAGTKP